MSAFLGIEIKNLQDYIEKNGGIVKSKVDSKLKYLLVKDEKSKQSSSQKILDAQKFNTTILTENEFINNYQI